MKVSDGLSVAEASRLLGWSEPTTRRHVGAGLDRVPGSQRPMRLTLESVERQRRLQLEKLGVHENSQAHDTATRQSEVEALRTENERLRVVITNLRLAMRAVDDALAQMTMPVTPND